MKNKLIEIGCDGGSIYISSKNISGIFFYEVKTCETFENSNHNSNNFVKLEDAWLYLKGRYPKWYQLYLVQITTQMTELVKKDYILAPDKNKYTMDVWLLHLTGRGIGF